MDESENWDARLAYPLSYACPPSYEVLPSFTLYLFSAQLFLPFFPLLLFQGYLACFSQLPHLRLSPPLALHAVGWSRCIGAAIMEMLNLTPSITELHPQWLMNPPILECLRILCCGCPSFQYHRSLAYPLKKSF